MLTIRRLGYLALLIGFAQVVFGAIVRITGSGLGCGDHWPDCYGSFTPVHNELTLVVEISHRYGAAALPLAIVALVLAAWVERKEGGASWAGGAEARTSHDGQHGSSGLQLMHAALSDGCRLALLVAAGFALVGGLVALFGLPRVPRARPASMPAAAAAGEA